METPEVVPWSAHNTVCSHVHMHTCTHIYTNTELIGWVWRNGSAIKSTGSGRVAENQLSSVSLLLHHEILDSELFELMHQNGDYTHFYFCYRWFLLDFKRGEKWVGLGIMEAPIIPVLLCCNRSYQEFKASVSFITRP